MSEDFKAFTGALGHLTPLGGTEKIPLLDPITGVTKYATAAEVASLGGGGGGGSGYNIKAVIAALPPLLHYWKLNDAPGSLTAHDSGPGAQDLVAYGSPQFGALSISGDGEPSVYMDGTTPRTLQLPIHTFPDTGDWSFGFLVKTRPKDFNGMMSYDGSGNFTITEGSAAQLQFILNAGGGSGTGIYPDTRTHLYIATVNRTATVTNCYYDGLLVSTQAFVPTAQVSTGNLGYFGSNGWQFGPGFMSDAFVCNAVLSQAQLWAIAAQIPN